MPSSSRLTEKRTVCAPYFAEFATICPSMKESHFASANTRVSSGTSTTGVTPRSMR